MKRFVSLSVAGIMAVALIGCTAEAPGADPVPTIQAPPSASSSQAVPEVIQMKEITLVDQDYTGVSSQKGAEWLRAINTKLIKGDITDGELVVTLSRGTENTSWSAAGVYIAPLAQGEGFTYPDESRFGTRLHFLSAEWRGTKAADGTCARSLAPSSSFGVLKGHDATLTVKLRNVAMTQPDPCQKGSVTVDILDLINSGGVYLGFAPSDRQTAPYMKVVLRYRGTIDVTAF